MEFLLLLGELASDLRHPRPQPRITRETTRTWPLLDTSELRSSPQASPQDFPSLAPPRPLTSARPQSHVLRGGQLPPFMIPESIWGAGKGGNRGQGFSSHFPRGCLWMKKGAQGSGLPGGQPCNPPGQQRLGKHAPLSQAGD